MEKTSLFQYIVEHRQPFIDLADYIYDHPETGYQEYQACAAITKLLEEYGFSVERNLVGIETAFRAIYENGSGGPSIGLLCEYDALEKVGHACSHHLQAPIIVLAALAVKECLKDMPYKLVVYGTPAEEGLGGKILMEERGCFNDIDLSLMVHGWSHTFVDVKSYASWKYVVEFFGKSTHAALNPYDGRSAMDALLLAFQGVEFMREHVRDTSRMHYTVLDAGGPANVVPAYASGSFMLRSFSNRYIEEMDVRFRNIIQGAALMTGTDYKIDLCSKYIAKVPSFMLNDLMIENAKTVGVPRIIPPIEEAGSTDFATVMYKAPGAVIRIAFSPEDAAPHSQGMLLAGKSPEAKRAVVQGAQVIAGVCCDIISQPGLLQEITEEFQETKRKMAQ